MAWNLNEHCYPKKCMYKQKYCAFNFTRTLNKENFHPFICQYQAFQGDHFRKCPCYDLGSVLQTLWQLKSENSSGSVFYLNYLLKIKHNDAIIRGQVGQPF